MDLFGGQKDVTTTTAPWAAQQPYLKDLFERAKQWSYDPNQPNVLNSINQYANSGGYGLMPNTNNTLNSFITGNMMNSNPYLQGMANAANNSTIQQYQNAVAPGIDSNFSANGRYGSGAMQNQSNIAQQNLATSLANTNNTLYGNAYNQGMNNMLQAVSMAPSTATANINTMNAGNMAQLQNLQGYSSLIGGNYGGTSTTPRFNNPIGVINVNNKNNTVNGTRHT